MKEKNTILFVNSVPEEAKDAVKKCSEILGIELEIAVIKNTKATKLENEPPEGIAHDIRCEFDRPFQLEKALLPYKEQLLTVVCRGEKHIASFAKLIPHVPYVRTPTAQSLLWATDKISMRNLLKVHDNKITPRFSVVHDAQKETIDKIVEKVGFPLVVKPSGLAASLLVTICFHREDLERSLKIVLRKIRKLYKEEGRVTQPQILVEQFMEGEMYSIDAYVGSRGNVYFCPLVHVKTGRAIGFDDFFNYQRIVPTTLDQHSIKAAQEVAQKAIHALNLRHVTAHVELMKTDAGWKVIELAPRIGGFRHRLYELSFGINHSMNDILIRLPKTPVIPKKRKGYAGALKFFAKKEGVITSIKGLKRVQQLSSFVELKQHLKIGQKAVFSKHGGKGVCDVVFFNKSRSELLADMRRTEQLIEITTENGKSKGTKK